MVLFVFQFYPVVVFENLTILDLALSGVTGLIHCSTLKPEKRPKQHQVTICKENCPLMTHFVTPGVAPTVQALHLFKLLIMLQR